MVEEDLNCRNNIAVLLTVVCPECGVLHLRHIPAQYQLSKYAWRVSGYIVAMCDYCERSYHKIRRIFDIQ